MMHGQRVGAAVEQQAHDVGYVETRGEPERRGAGPRRVEIEVDRIAPHRCGGSHRGIGVGAVVEERADQTGVLVQDRGVQRRIPGVGRVRVGALLQQEDRNVTVSAVRGDDRRARAVGRLVVYVGAGRDEQFCRGKISHPRREQQWRVAALRKLRDILRIPRFRRRLDDLRPDLRPGIDGGAVSQQHVDDRGMALGHRPHQRRLAAAGRERRVRAGLEEPSSDARRADARRSHQRRLAGEQRGVRVRVRVEQTLHHPGAAVLGGGPERRHAEVVGGVHVGAGANQEVGRLDLVPVGGPVQRRRPVPLAGRDILPLFDQRAHGAPVGPLRSVREGLVRSQRGGRACDNNGQCNRAAGRHHRIAHAHGTQCRTPDPTCRISDSLHPPLHVDHGIAWQQPDAGST